MLHIAILSLAIATVDTVPPARRELTPHAKPAPAVEYSDAYYTRLTIHRIGSYAMLPLFAGEYYLGDKLLNGSDNAEWIKPVHVGVAMGIGGLFTANTVTGLWNLWDARHDPNGRTLRILHTSLMLAADAGFALTPLFADDDDSGKLSAHKNVALASMSVATLGTAIMWFRRD